VRKKIEELRAAGQVGSSLQAEVDFYADGGDYELLRNLGEDSQVRDAHVRRPRASRERRAARGGCAEPAPQCERLLALPPGRRRGGALRTAAAATCTDPAKNGCMPKNWRWFRARSRDRRRRPGRQMGRACQLCARRAARADGFFNLVLVFNKGAAFSFLADAPGWPTPLFVVFSLVAAVIVSVLLFRSPGRALFYGEDSGVCSSAVRGVGDVHAHRLASASVAFLGTTLVDAHQQSPIRRSVMRRGDC